MFGFGKKNEGGGEITNTPSESVLEREGAEVILSAQNELLEKIKAMLLVGMISVGVSEAVAQTPKPKGTEGPKASFSGSSEVETGSSSLEFPGLHPALIIQDKDGNWKFNPLGLLFMYQLELSESTPKSSTVEVGVPNDYSRAFDTGRPTDPEDMVKADEFIRRELNRELVDKLHALGINKEAEVYGMYHGQPNLSHLKIKQIKITGTTSPEGPQFKGKSTLEQGNVDEENVHLGELRAQTALESTKRGLRNLGLNDAQIETAIVQIDSQEIQFDDAELLQLAAISADQPGADDIEKIFNLIVKYNNGEVQDGLTHSLLDQIVASKRAVNIEVSYEGEQKDTIIVPIPLILLLLLKFPHIRIPGWPKKVYPITEEPLPPENGSPNNPSVPTNTLTPTLGDTIIPEVVPVPEKPPRKELPPHMVPEKIIVTKLPPPEDPEYIKMEEETVIYDLGVYFDDIERKRRGIDYRMMADIMDSRFDSYPDDENREEYLTYLVIMAWKDHDRTCRQEAGLDGKALDDGLDYENQEHQIKWARMHAKVLLDLVKQRRHLSNEPDVEKDYLDLLPPKVMDLVKRKTIREKQVR